MKRERTMSIERKIATENNRVEFRTELQREKYQRNGGRMADRNRHTDKKER